MNLGISKNSVYPAHLGRREITFTPAVSSLLVTHLDGLSQVIINISGFALDSNQFPGNNGLIKGLWDSDTMIG